MKTKKTCKDCELYEPYNGGKYVMKCTHPDTLTYWDNINKCSDLKPKSKDMKKIKVDQKKMLKYYNRASPEMQAEARADFPEVFKSELPKTWAEFCEITERFLNYADMYLKEITNYYNSRGCEISVSQEFVKIDKYTALSRLEELRDHYNDGWKPDCVNPGEMKYMIRKNENTITTGTNYTISRFLSFKTKELRDEFLTNFKGLIIQAEDLI